MSDDYFEESRQSRLVNWGLAQMMKGAGYAAIFVVGIGVLLWAVYLIGLLLPDESRQTPSPYGALEMRIVPEGHDAA